MKVSQQWPSRELPVQDATGVDCYPPYEHSFQANISRAREAEQALPDLTEAEQKFSQAAYTKNRARPPKLASTSLLRREAGVPKCSFLTPEGASIHVQSPDDLHRAGASGSRHSLSDNVNLAQRGSPREPPPLATLSFRGGQQQDGAFSSWPEHSDRQQTLSSMSSAHSKSRVSPASQRIPKYAWSSGDESADEADPQQAVTKHALSSQQEQHLACPGPDEAQLRTRISRARHRTGSKPYMPPHAHSAAQKRPPDARALRLRVRRLSPVMHLDDTDDSEDESQACDDITDPAWPVPASVTDFRSTGSLPRASAGRTRNLNHLMWTVLTLSCVCHCIKVP